MLMAKRSSPSPKSFSTTSSAKSITAAAEGFTLVSSGFFIMMKRPGFTTSRRLLDSQMITVSSGTRLRKNSIPSARCSLWQRS